MARISTAMLAAVLAAGLVTSASAQGGGGQGRGRGGFGGRGGGFGGGIMMLRSPDVQKDLKMTQPQVDKIDAKQQEVMQAMRDAFQGGGGGQGQSPEERQAMMKKIQDLQAKAVSDILDTTQQKRFKQLEIQQQGGQALLNNKEVAEALKITDDQRQKLEGIRQSAMQELQNAPRPDFQNATPEERQAFMTKMQTAMKAVSDKMLASLSPAQQAKWKELTGEPFKGQFMPQFRRPGA